MKYTPGSDKDTKHDLAKITYTAEKGQKRLALSFLE